MDVAVTMFVGHMGRDVLDPHRAFAPTRPGDRLPHGHIVGVSQRCLPRLSLQVAPRHGPAARSRGCNKATPDLSGRQKAQT